MSDAKELRVFKKDRLFVDGGIVEIKIGDNETTTHIHLALLYNRSVYIRQKCNEKKDYSGPWCLSLPREFGDIDSLRLYVQYIYSGKLPCKDDRQHTLHIRYDDVECEALAGLYIMAQGLEDQGAMDAAISAMLRFCQEPSVDEGVEIYGAIPSDEAVDMAYKATAASSPLRRLMVDLYAWASDSTHLSKDMSPEFLLDLAGAVMDKHRESRSDHSGDFASVSCCDYHGHNPKAACASRKRKRGDKDGGDDEEVE